MACVVSRLFDVGVAVNTLTADYVCDTVKEVDVSENVIQLQPTVTTYNPIDDIYKEVRWIRQYDETIRRRVNMVEQGGNIDKGGGKFTPRYAVYVDPWLIRPDPFTTSLEITGEQISNVGTSGNALMDFSTQDPLTSISVAYAPSEAEVIVVGGGSGGSSAEEIADAVWDEPLGQHIIAGSTGEQLANTSVNVDTAAIATAVWANVSRTLTESAGVTAQDIIDIASAVWSEATRSLTQSPMTGVDYNNIADEVWEQDLAAYLTAGSAGLELKNKLETIDTVAIASAVWANATRTLTSDQSLDPSDITTIANSVWAVTTRSITEDVTFGATEINAVRDAVWNATVRTLTQATSIDAGDITAIENAVWSATSRTITDSVNVAPADITGIRDAVWAAATRELTSTTTDLTTAQVNLIRDAVWLAAARTLTETVGLEADERAQLLSLPDEDTIANAVLDTVVP